MSNIDERVLAQALGEALREAPEGLRFRRSSLGRFNSTWFVEGSSGSCVLRVAPPDERDGMLFYEHRMMRQEPEVHECIRTNTTVPVPKVLAFREADPALGRDFIVFECLPGTAPVEHPRMDAEKFDVLLRQIGAALRQVHAITRSEYGYLGAHRPMEPEGSWQNAFLTMWQKLLDDIERCSGYDAGELEAMRRLPELYSGLFDFSKPASLMHMDVWSENILADDDGNLTGLLDWDRALWGDPEIEFAVLDYCGISGPAFWEGYGAPREDDRDARVRKIFYLLYEVQKYIVIHRARRNNPSSAEHYRRHALELARALMR